MAKKDTKKTTEPKEIPTLTAADLASPHIKAWLKQKADKEKQSKKEKHIPAILAAANKETGEKFETFKAMVRYFAPPTKKKRGKRSAPLTAEEKQTVKAYDTEGKSVSEIATLLKKSTGQIYRVLNEE